MDIIARLFDPASVDFHGLKIEGPAIVVVIALVAFVYAFIVSLVWVYKDAKRRNKHGLIALLFILLTGWPASFLWWFWLRPPIESQQPQGKSRT